MHKINYDKSHLVPGSSERDSFVFGCALGNPDAALTRGIPCSLKATTKQL